MSRVLRQFGHAFEAESVKRAVSDWAYQVDFHPLVEHTGVVDGRIDLLLVPMTIKCPMFVGLGDDVRRRKEPYDWTTRLGLAGVEVKVNRSDFLNGLDGQFERYARSLAGLYIAGPPDVVVAREVPEQYGVLSVALRDHKQGWRVSCRRHPKWVVREASTGDMWRVIWAMHGEYRKHFREADEERRNFMFRIRETTGRVISKAVAEAVKGPPDCDD